MENLEKLEFLVDPMDYFNKIGDGYAIIFRYAAIGAHTEIKTMKRIEKLGQTIGTLISFRDSVQDLKRDRNTGSFNPFITWKDENILLYYQNNSRKLIENVNNLTKNISLKLNTKNESAASNNSYIYNRPQALGSLVKYASIATTPFLGCRTRHTAQPLQINCYDLCPGFDLSILLIPLAIIFICCSCFMSCYRRISGEGERRESGSTGSSCGGGGSDCGGCGDCGASDCGDCGCGDCGGCDAGGCDCSC